MAGRFTEKQWDAIEKKLIEDPAKYGMPEGGREESMVFASFNIRKLGSHERRQRELKFMARFCARCDLVAIQEVQDDLRGLRYLKAQVDERVSSAGEYDLVVSDITGETPGKSGMAERLAFLYRKSRVRRLYMTSDLTIDRTDVLDRYRSNDALMNKAWEKFDQQMKRFEEGKRKTKPTFAPPVFISFTRTPHVAAFEIPAAGRTHPVRFTAVNAHLIYGTMKERKEEFRALVHWLTMRLNAEERLVAPNFILLGDLNMNFDSPVKDREEAEKFIGELKKEAFGDADAKRIYFPFIGDHPRTKKPIRSNARHDQTYDQIGFFLNEREPHLPRLGWADKIVRKNDPPNPDAFDYGVFDFAELFSQVVERRAYDGRSKASKKEFGKHFEHSVSDHMPIWVRIPRPGF